MAMGCSLPPTTAPPSRQTSNDQSSSATHEGARSSRFPDPRDKAHAGGVSTSTRCPGVAAAVHPGRPAPPPVFLKPSLVIESVRD